MGAGEPALEPPAATAAAPAAAPAAVVDAAAADVFVVKKLFWAGCVALPWLWLLCLVHYRSRVFDPAASSVLRFYLRAQMIGLLVVTAAFVAWVVLFQQSWRSWGALGTNLLIYVPDDSSSFWWLN